MNTNLQPVLHLCIVSHGKNEILIKVGLTIYRKCNFIVTQSFPGKIMPEQYCIHSTL